jgi:hypothetical protein
MHRYRIIVGHLKRRGNFEELGIDGRIILKWFLKK